MSLTRDEGWVVSIEAVLAEPLDEHKIDVLVEALDAIGHDGAKLSTALSVASLQATDRDHAATVAAERFRSALQRVGAVPRVVDVVDLTTFAEHDELRALIVAGHA